MQTPSDYDTLVAKTMTPEWVEQHQPVISRRGPPGGIHTTYVKKQAKKPNGKIVLCHRRCNQPLIHRLGATNIRFECLECRSRCSVPLPEIDNHSTLGRKNLVKTRYPIEQCPGNWTDPAPMPSPGTASSHGPSQSRPNKRPSSQDLKQTTGQEKPKPKKPKKSKKPKNQEKV